MSLVVTNVGSANASTGATLSVTPAVAINVSQFIYVVTCESGTLNHGSVTDAGNNTTYSTVNGQTNNNGFGTVAVFVLPGASNLNGVSTAQAITWTKFSSTSAGTMNVFTVDGMSPADKVNADFFNAAQGNSTTPSVTQTGAATTNALVLGAVGWGAVNNSFTQDSTHGFATPPGNNATQNVNNAALSGGTVVTSGTATSTYSPTFGAAENWGIGIWIFNPGPPAPVYDLPPPGYPRLEQTWTQRHVQFKGQDNLYIRHKYSIPVAPYRLEQTTTFINNLGLRLNRPPIRNRDWPVPVAPFRLEQTWIETGNALFAIPRPFFNQDWPLPVPFSRLEQTTTAFYNRNLIGLDVLPFRNPPPDPGPLTWYRTWELNTADLFSTAPQNPFFQTDWPLPTPVPWYKSWEFWISQNLTAIPFNQEDWPVPVPYFRAEQTTTAFYNRNLIGQDQIPIRTGIDRPDPVIWYQDWNQNLQLSTLFKLVAPFFQTDWPNPQPVQFYRTWEAFYNRNLIGKDVLPIRNPVPLPAPLTWYEDWFNTPYLVSFVKPFLQSDWPLPTPPVRIEQTTTAFYNRNLIGKDVLPQRMLLDLPAPLTWYRDWSFDPFYTTLMVVITKPFLQSDWPTLIGYPRVEQTITSFYNRNLIGLDQLPIVTQFDRPDPIIWYQDWNQNLQLSTLFVTSAKPFLQLDWPLATPPVRLEQTVTSFYNRNLIGKDKLPVLLTDYPNPTPLKWFQDYALNIILLFPPPPPPPPTVGYFIPGLFGGPGMFQHLGHIQPSDAH